MEITIHDDTLKFKKTSKGRTLTAVSRLLYGLEEGWHSPLSYQIQFSRTHFPWISTANCYTVHFHKGPRASRLHELSA